MEAQEAIVNKVAESGLVTVSLEEYYPREEIKVFDLKEYLFRGLIIKEKEFRDALKNTDWNAFANTNVAVTCTADAIIPVWAYMLVASYLRPVTKNIILGDEEKLKETLLLENISRIPTKDFEDKRVVIKGCGELPIPDSAYFLVTSVLQPHVKSIMYGEPCSTVPVFKKKN
jgi:Protein of unknown function (DUF2480)